MKGIILIFLALFCNYYLQAQTDHSAATRDMDSIALLAKRLYQSGIKAKDGIGGPVNFDQAFYFFQQAAALGDPQSLYACAYFYYKGIAPSIPQNYFKAAELLRIGANAGRDNSQYLLGLIFRNGYLGEKREDSAKYWLEKAAKAGYQQAIQELKMKEPENGPNALAVLKKVQTAEQNGQKAVNTYIPIVGEIPDSIAIEGTYNGYIIQYDWSGQYIISSKKLLLSLKTSEINTGLINCQWNEEGLPAVALKASIDKGILLFDSSYYSRKDHYSPERGIKYEFKKGTLNLIKRKDSVYLSGNIIMFSNERNEPSKPLYIALIKTDSTPSNLVSAKKVAKYHTDSLTDKNNVQTAKIISVYPNPFTSYINVDFAVFEEGAISVELFTLDGKLIYKKPSKQLKVGKYSIKVIPQRYLPEQAYILRLVYKNGANSVKVIKNSHL